MKVGLDVMGGDFAPEATIRGAILSLNELNEDDRIVLIGPEQLILNKLSEYNVEASRFDIVHADEVIEMGDSPIKSFTRKKNSSISIGFGLLSQGKIDAFSSAGNSGAMLVGSMYSISTIKGVIRPSTAAFIPKVSGGLSLLLDVGTNADVRPDVMYQFAIIGSLYAHYVYGIENPRIGLLNIGEEEEKGNLLTQSTHPLMKDSQDFNFIGNIEGRELFSDKADVIVCDGFTGNVIIKQIEALYTILKDRGLTDDYINKFDYENYGGSPILGVNGTVVIGHGISNEKAIKNMISMACDVHRASLHEKLRDAFKSYAENNNDKDQERTAL